MGNAMTRPGFAVPQCARIGLGGCVTRLVEIRVAQMLGRNRASVHSDRGGSRPRSSKPPPQPLPPAKSIYRFHVGT
jgi:hypothetical protein